MWPKSLESNNRCKNVLISFMSIVVVQLLSCVRLFETPWTAAHQASLFFTVSHSLLKCMSIELVMLSNHLILCHPFFLCLLFFPASGSFPVNQLFTSDSQSIGASASASVLPMNIQSLIDWSDLLAVQGTLNNLLQHHISKTSVLWCSAFFMVQLLHPYVTIGTLSWITN